MERKEAEAGDTPMESVGDQEKQDTSIEAFPTPDAEKRSTSSGEDDEDLDADQQESMGEDDRSPEDTLAAEPDALPAHQSDDLDEELVMKTKEQEDLNQLLTTLSESHTQLINLIQKIAKATDDEDLQALCELLPLLDDLMKLYPSECPEAEKELKALASANRERLELVRRTHGTTSAELQALLEAAKKVDGAKVATDTLDARLVAGESMKRETDSIKKTSEAVDTDEWSKMSEEKQNEAIEDEQSKRIRQRAVVMKEVVPKCLEDSSWPKPLKLKEIYDQKKQATVVEQCGKKAVKDQERSEAVMKELREHQETLGTDWQTCKELCKSEQKAVNESMEKVTQTRQAHEAALKEYLENTIRHEAAVIVEGKIADKVAAVEDEIEQAEKAQKEAKEAAEACHSEAQESFEEIHSKVKETALKLKEKAFQPAFISVVNTEFICQVTQKLCEEKRNQLALTKKELKKVESAKAEKAEKEQSCKGTNKSKLVADRLRLQQKANKLKEAEEEIKRQQNEAEDLYRQADEQREELKCLAELGYEIDSGKAKETAEAEAEDAFGEAIFRDEEGDDGDDLDEEDYGQNHALALQHADVLQKLQQSLEKKDQELAKEKEYRKHAAQQTQEAREQMKRMECRVQELEAALIVRDSSSAERTTKSSGGPCPVGWTEVTQIARGERSAHSGVAE